MAKTLIDLDEDILRKALRTTGLTKKVDVVNHALAQLVRQGELEHMMRRLKGAIHWEGDLARMRRNRHGVS